MNEPDVDKLPGSGPLDLASIIECSPCVAIAWRNQSDWPVDYVSANIRQFGYDPAEFLSGRLAYRSLIHPDDQARVESELLVRVEAGADQHREKYRLRHGAGHWIWVEGYIWLVRDQSGAVTRRGGVLIDVTEQELIALALRESEHRFRSLFENLERISVQGYDHEHKVRFWNRASEQLYGYSSVEAQGRTLESLIIPPPMRDHVARAIDAWASGGASISAGELVLQDKYGGPVPVYSSHVMMTDSRGRRELYCVDIDLSEQKSSEAQLRQAAMVFEHAREGIMITDADGRIVDVNLAFNRITGFDREEALGRSPQFLVSDDHDDDFFQGLGRTLVAEGHWTGEILSRHKSGECYPQMLTIASVRGEQGDIQRYIGLLFDISELKAYQRKLEYQAHYDALTGLPNRLLLTERLKLTMAQVKRRQQRVAVVYVDLDNFKMVNDRYGHETGDRLLAALADRMRYALREGDTLARIGGDEFVAVLVDIDDVDQSLQVLDRVLAAASDPLQMEGLRLQVSASAGVTFYPQGIEEIEADQLVRQADQAMYQAKLAGKNRFQLFDAEYDRSLRSRHEVCAEVKRGLASAEFVLFYQPKVNMRTGVVVGAEALIRWRHPERGLVPPMSFLPIIARDMLEVKLGVWVIREALSQLARWREQGLEFPLTVNISGFHLQQTGFCADLKRLLAEYPELPPGGFGLEVLESSALDDMQLVSEVIVECAALGVPFSLDDFGTGYSSLTYLKQLPAQELKIDQSFVRDMLEDPDDLAILEGVLGLARAFSRSVIAEGVETVAHGEVLLHLGCELAQGYGIARPMPAADIPAWLASWQLPPAWRQANLLRREALPLLYASVEHRAWMTALRGYLEGGRTTPPVTGVGLCRVSQLLAEAPFRTASECVEPDTLADLHERLHAAADALVEEFRHLPPLAVAAGLQSVDQLSAQLLELLDQIIHSPRYAQPGL